MLAIECVRANMADFWHFSQPAHSQKTVKTVTNKTVHPNMVARSKPLHRYTEINSF